MNDIIKHNLRVLFTLALLSILQGCSHSPTTQSVVTAKNVTTSKGKTVAGDYISPYSTQLKLNPDGTGTEMGRHSWGQSHSNVKYRIDGDKVIVDYYLSELDWKLYQNSDEYNRQLRAGKSPDQIKADVMVNKIQHSTLSIEGDNALCESKTFCFVRF